MPIESRLARRLTDGVCDLLLPPHCLGCDTLLPPLPDGEAILCSHCRTAWEAARAEAAAPAAEALGHGHAFAVLYHSGQTDGVPERVIYHIKHIGSPRAFAFVAHSLRPRVQALLSRDATLDDSLSPIYTYPPRRRRAVNEDGFDQASRLAKALAHECDGVYASLLRRTRRLSKEQKRLDTVGRRANAAASYALRPRAVEQVQGRTVILCDDLSTTGATLTQCAKLLLEAGAARVFWVTVGQTQDKRGTV